MGQLNASFYIGSDKPSYSRYWNGYMDEIRVSNMARYTPGTDFTPSKTKFVKDNQTLLLIHSDEVNNSVTFTSDEVQSNLIAPVGDVTQTSRGYVTGNRNSSITVTNSGITWPSNAIDYDTTAVDGMKAHNWTAWGAHAWFTNNEVPTGGYFRYDFATPTIVDEAKWYQMSGTHSSPGCTDTHGTWKWQGSNDASAWTDIGNSFTLGGSTLAVTNSGPGGYYQATQVHTELNGNTTAYRYYQLVHVSGAVSSNPYLIEIEFASEDVVKKFGTSSIYFDGSGDYLSIPQSSDFNFGTGLWTVEFWYKSVDSNLNSLVCIGDWDCANGPVTIYQSSDGDLAVNYRVDGSHLNNETSGTTAIDTGAWVHIAVSRTTSTTLKAFVNGVEDTSVAETISASASMENLGTYSGRTVFNIGRMFEAGSAKTNYDANCYIDEIRISNTARYTSNFTPSTTAFTADSNTLLLIHGDGSGNLFTDDSYTTGKQTQLHGWAVNY